MKVKVTVIAQDGRQVEHSAEIEQDSELPEAVGVALREYRRAFPDAPETGYEVRIGPG